MSVGAAIVSNLGAHGAPPAWEGGPAWQHSGPGAEACRAPAAAPAPSRRTPCADLASSRRTNQREDDFGRAVSMPISRPKRQPLVGDPPRGSDAGSREDERRAAAPSPLILVRPPQVKSLLNSAACAGSGAAGSGAGAARVLRSLDDMAASALEKPRLVPRRLGQQPSPGVSILGAAPRQRRLSPAAAPDISVEADSGQEWPTGATTPSAPTSGRPTPVASPGSHALRDPASPPRSILSATSGGSLPPKAGVAAGKHVSFSPSCKAPPRTSLMTMLTLFRSTSDDEAEAKLQQESRAPPGHTRTDSPRPPRARTPRQEERDLVGQG